MAGLFGADYFDTINTIYMIGIWIDASRTRWDASRDGYGTGPGRLMGRVSDGFKWLEINEVR